MVLKTIPINGDGGYEIRVTCDGGLYRAQGFKGEEPVTPEVTKSVLLAVAESMSDSAADYEASTARAIQECGIEKCTTLEEAWAAITSKLPDKSECAYRDLVSVVEVLLKHKPKLLFTDASVC